MNLTKAHKRITSLFIACFIFIGIASCEIANATSAETACEQRAITYLSKHGILKGAGDGNLSLDSNITVEQLCIMLCRSFHICERTPMLTAYDQGWIDEQALCSQDSFLSQQAFYKIVFRAFSIPVYSSILYDSGDVDPSIPDVIRTASDIGLYASPSSSKQAVFVSRASAIQVIFRLLTEEFNVVSPPFSQDLRIFNPEDVMTNKYLLELRQIPEEILHTFAEKNWSYHIDSRETYRVSRQLGMNCVGVTYYGRRSIYVSEPMTTIHEFGHFLDSCLDFPSTRDGLFQEAKSSGLFLRNYARTSPKEYFAECFVFWVATQDNPKARSEFAQYCPKTYTFFSSLENNGWK